MKERKGIEIHMNKIKIIEEMLLKRNNLKNKKELIGLKTLKHIKKNYLNMKML